MPASLSSAEATSCRHIPKDRARVLLSSVFKPFAQDDEYGSRAISRTRAGLGSGLEVILPTGSRIKQRICPGKARIHGQELFLEAMAHCAARMPSGSVSGEIIAGVEPIERTHAAIDLIAKLGAFPTVCIFRPTLGSDMEDWPSPAYDAMRDVMVHVYEACRRHWIPVGLAPRIEVSLVVTPDETALLAPRTAGFYAYEAYLRMAALAARPLFAHRLRARSAH